MRTMLLVILAFLPISLSASVTDDAVEDFVTAAWPDSGAPGLAYAAIDKGKAAAGARGTTLAGSEAVVAALWPAPALKNAVNAAPTVDVIAAVN